MGDHDLFRQFSIYICIIERMKYYRRMIKLSAIKCAYKAAWKMFKIERSFLDDFWIFIERNSVRKGVTDNNRERIKDTDEQCADPLGICNYSIDNSFVKMQIRLWIIKRSKSAHYDDVYFFNIYLNRYFFSRSFRKGKMISK